MIGTFSQWRRELESDDCREVTAAAAALVDAGFHVEADALGRARQCLLSKRGRFRAPLARAYLHLLDPQRGSAEAESLLRRDTNPEVRSEAFRALVDFGKRALPVLHTLSQNEDGTVRWYAYRAASRIHGAEALPLLVTGLGDDDPTTRLAVAYELAARGPIAFGPTLHSIATQPPSAGLHHAARIVLRRVAPPAWTERVAPLLEALRGPWPAFEAPFIARNLLDDLTHDSEGGEETKATPLVGVAS